VVFAMGRRGRTREQRTQSLERGALPQPAPLRLQGERSALRSRFGSLPQGNGGASDGSRDGVGSHGGVMPLLHP